MTVFGLQRSDFSDPFVNTHVILEDRHSQKKVGVKPVFSFVAAGSCTACIVSTIQSKQMWARVNAVFFCHATATTRAQCQSNRFSIFRSFDTEKIQRETGPPFIKETRLKNNHTTHLESFNNRSVKCFVTTSTSWLNSSSKRSNFFLLHPPLAKVRRPALISEGDRHKRK